MEIQDRTQDVIDQKTLEYADRLLVLLRQKKEVELSIKDLQADYKLDGVEVAKVNSSINRMKRKMKQTDIARAQETQMDSLLGQSDSVTLGVAGLVE